LDAIWSEELNAIPASTVATSMSIRSGMSRSMRSPRARARRLTIAIGRHQPASSAATTITIESSVLEPPTNASQMEIPPRTIVASAW
jgi:hypothetical protein